MALPSKRKPFLKGDLHPMAKLVPIDEQFQHFVAELKESFWEDVYGQTRQAWQRFFELQSDRQRDRFSGWAPYERPAGEAAAGLPQRLLRTAAIRTVYPQVRHRRCWVHRMRNILEKARQCDYHEVKAGAQATYLAENRNPGRSRVPSLPRPLALPLS